MGQQIFDGHPKKKHLTLWAPAFLPERTAAVAIILIAYLAILRPDGGSVVSTVFGLLITGGLVAAVITSPHAIIDLIDTIDQAQEEARNWHRPRRGYNYRPITTDCSALLIARTSSSRP